MSNGGPDTKQAWLCFYKDKRDGQLKSGTLTVPTYREAEQKFMAVFGPVVDWELGVRIIPRRNQTFALQSPPHK